MDNMSIRTGTIAQVKKKMLLGLVDTVLQGFFAMFVCF